MQEEVTQKTFALSMKTGKLTAQALQAALKKYLQHRAKGPKLHHGRQSLKQLKAHGAALTNIEVTEANIGAFKPCAKKYGVDFTLRKDNKDPYMIVFVYKTGFKNSVDGKNFKPLRKNSKENHSPAVLCSHASNEAESMCSDSSDDTLRMCHCTFQGYRCCQLISTIGGH